MQSFKGALLIVFFASSAMASTTSVVPAEKMQDYVEGVNRALEQKPLACLTNHDSTVWIDSLRNADEIQKVITHSRSATLGEKVLSAGTVEQVQVPNELIFRTHVDKNLESPMRNEPANLISQITAELTADGKSVVSLKIEWRTKLINGTPSLLTIDQCK
jgi:hypothetical protein